jgi:cbb3-type cytochrome oxidase subunit 3
MALVFSVVLIWLFAVQGKTALDYARQKAHTQIIQLLMK